MDRYQRQKIYKNFSKTSQKRLRSAKVSIIGAGALGNSVSDLLVRAGIGNITLFDEDSVELVNLHRQTLFTEKDVGKSKVLSAKNHLEKINSDVIISVCEKFVSEDDLLTAGLLDDSDLVIDCTDNMEARLFLNKYCIKKRIALLHVSAIEETGNVIFFENNVNKSPCLRCIYNENMKSRKCSELGVLNTITTGISAIASMTAIKFLINEKIETNIILRLNIWNNNLEKIKIKHNPLCPICSD
ncbi:MAG: HesA/MoeB/ThiF family protein [Candidatus Woesearchaeota archaeon]